MWPGVAAKYRVAGVAAGVRRVAYLASIRGGGWASEGHKAIGFDGVGTHS